MSEPSEQSTPASFYASPGEARLFWLPRRQDEAVTVADNYFIRPLIPLLNRDKEFYILAVAQKNARLLRCTEFTSEEISLPKETPTTLREDTQTRKPDHVLDNRVSAGPSVGTGTGVMFGTSTDKEDKDEIIFRKTITLKNGRILIAAEYGLEAFPIRIRRGD